MTETLVEPKVGENQGETFSYTSWDLYTHEITEVVVAHTRLGQEGIVHKPSAQTKELWTGDSSWDRENVFFKGVALGNSSGQSHTQEYMDSTN